MINNPGRRAFIKKNLILLSGVPLYGCGGGGSGGTPPPSSAPTPTPTPTPTPILPSFIIQPSSNTVSPGESATFQVLANGSEPLSYQWLRNGSTIAGATDLSYTTSPAALGDDALFSVIVTNAAGTVDSQEALLTVTADLVPASITAEPSDQAAIEGRQASFQVIADGSPPLSYQWLRNGQPILGATDTSYATPALVLGEDALFSVLVTNDAGAVTSREAQLTVTTQIANTITIDSTTVMVDSTLLTVDSA